MDEDLDQMDTSKLLATAKGMRSAIRKHRDCSGHDLCWFQPEMWMHLPETPSGPPVVPEWPEFIHNCAAFRGTLDRPQCLEVKHSAIEAKITEIDYEHQVVYLEYCNFLGGTKLSIQDFPCYLEDLVPNIGKVIKLFKIMVVK